MNQKLKLFLTSSRFKIALWYTSLFLLLELLLGISIYFYLYHKSKTSLDLNLMAQGDDILQSLEEKHFDLEFFKPDSTYKSEDELIWDILYETIVFNRRNTFIQISNSKKILFKTANLSKTSIDKTSLPNTSAIIDYNNDKLSLNPIRLYYLQGKIYSVIVAYPTEQIYQTLQGLTDLYLMISPIFLIISLLGGIMISVKSLARIDQLIKRTEEITAHNLEEKIPGGEFKDEFGRLVNKMNEMIARIKKSVEYMNDFSLSAAHELKTPLTILRGEIEVALKSEKPKEMYIEVLKSNYEETIRLTRIVDNLFLISKSEKAILKLNYSSVNLNKFLDSLANSLKILGLEKKINLYLKASTELNVRFDAELIKQALSNIIDNAFKFGEINSDVIVNFNAFDNKVKIDVSNIGAGIPAQNLQLIFEKFYRLDNTSTHQTAGAGLGLAVVKSIVDAHKGEVSAYSVPSKETVFSIILPITQSSK